MSRWKRSAKNWRCRLSSKPRRGADRSGAEADRVNPADRLRRRPRLRDQQNDCTTNGARRPRQPLPAGDSTPPRRPRPTSAKAADTAASRRFPCRYMSRAVRALAPAPSHSLSLMERFVIARSRHWLGFSNAPLDAYVNEGFDIVQREESRSCVAEDFMVRISAIRRQQTKRVRHRIGSPCVRAFLRQGCLTLAGPWTGFGVFSTRAFLVWVRRPPASRHRRRRTARHLGGLRSKA